MGRVRTTTFVASALLLIGLPSSSHAEDAIDAALSAETDATTPLPEASHPDLLDEAEYAEAVIAFNGRKNQDAIKILDVILKRTPGHLGSLELLALLQKTTGKEDESLATYQKILKAKPPAERGPYHFEVGTILFKRKNFTSAQKFFDHALRRNFNAVACHFFLGLIDLGERKFPSASDHFRAVTDSGNNEFVAAAHYYLGVAQYQLGAGTEGTSELLEARDRAAKFPDNALAQQVSKAASEALKPQGGSRWFGNFSTLGQNDTNVLLTPDSLPDSASAGKASAKVVLSGSIGRMSSALEPWQWVPSFRTVLNRNFNEDAAEAQFITSNLVFFLNRRPLAANNWGIKTEVASTFQFLTTDSSSSSGSYSPYSYTGEIGGYGKIRLSPNWKLLLEAAARPQNFLTDESTGTAQRSGYSAALKTTLRSDTGFSSLVKPELALGTEYFRTEGVDFRGLTWSADLSNTARILGRDAWTLGVSVQGVNYPERSEGGRSDTTLTVRTSYIIPLSSSLAILTDASWTNNISNVDDLFSYKRTLVSAGVNFSF